MRYEDVKPGMRVRVVSDNGDETVQEDIGRVFTVDGVDDDIVWTYGEDGPSLGASSICDIEPVEGHPTADERFDAMVDEMRRVREDDERIASLNRGKIPDELTAADEDIMSALEHIQNARIMMGEDITKHTFFTALLQSCARETEFLRTGIYPEELDD